jgi:hypothetical protein
MKDGIRFSSTYQISQEEPTAATILRPSESPSTLIAELEGYTSQIVSIPKRSYLQNSNYSCLFKNSNDKHYLFIQHLKYSLDKNHMNLKSFAFGFGFALFPKIRSKLPQFFAIHELLFTVFFQLLNTIRRNFCIFCHVFMENGSVV